MDKSYIELRIYSVCPYDVTDEPIVEAWHVASDRMVDEGLTEIYPELIPLGLCDLMEGVMELDPKITAPEALRTELETLGFSCRMMNT
jgi:hypothetical protein